MELLPYNVVLLDIEGTTTSISFVKDVLFPYARTNLTEFLTENWSDPDVSGIVQEIGLQCELDIKNGVLGVPLVHCQPTDDPTTAMSSVIQNVLWQMDQDRKTTGLKALQGKIWKSGYDFGLITSHVFPDVQEVLIRWTNSKKVYIYSSGSIAAQKLLFAHTEFGDFTQYLSGYFDTTTGSKVEAESYRKIASQLNEVPERILFLTDSPLEAEAASEAGMQVIVTIRPGNQELPVHIKNKFNIANNFDQLS